MSVEQERLARVDQLIRDLERPMYVYKMARAYQHGPGGRKRMLNAAREIDAIAEAYDPRLKPE